jgi:hypothetical protein
MHGTVGFARGVFVQLLRLAVLRARIHHDERE